MARSAMHSLDGGEPLASSSALFRGHPLHRRDEVEVDGARVRIRPVLPDDAAAVARFVRDLSSTTRYRRFLSGVDRLSAGQLAAIIDVDHADRETLLAFARVDSRWQLVGVAQYVRTGEDQAEIAIVVADAWQRRGVGTALAAHLAAAAAEEGITAFAATALADNPGPQRLARALSRTVAAVADGTTVGLTIGLVS